MKYTNQKQAKKINELIQLIVSPQNSGEHWVLQSIKFVESKELENQLELIQVVLMSSNDSSIISIYDIDINGNARRVIK